MTNPQDTSLNGDPSYVLVQQDFIDLQRILLEKVRSLGINSLSVSYDGSGDSGEVSDIRCDKEDLDLGSIDSGVTHTQTSIVGEEISQNEVSVSLEDLIKDIAYDALEEVESGWEIEDGSHGTVTFKIDTGEILIEHYSRYQEREEDARSGKLEADSGSDAQMEVVHGIIDLLKGMGVVRLSAQYEGYGDSGETLEIAAYDKNGVQIDTEVLEAKMATFPDVSIAGQHYSKDYEQDMVDHALSLMDWIVENEDPGFEQDSGGGGELVLNIEDFSWHLESYSNVDDSEYREEWFASPEVAQERLNASLASKPSGMKG